MTDWRSRLDGGIVIPACPLALNEDGSWSERHQRALARYYVTAGAGGVAVGVHTTQFAIREPAHDLYKPVLNLMSEAINQAAGKQSIAKVAGICGHTAQATAEADIAVQLGYHAGLLSLSALTDATDDELVAHCQAVSETIPVFGFYLQPAAGGRLLSYRFWRRFCEIENVVAIKIAAFNRYQTWDVIRAVIESERTDIVLYTGNDDNIIGDLLTPFTWRGKTRWFAGGLLGQWAVWTNAAVKMLRQIHEVRRQPTISPDWLSRNVELTDANAALFDAANGFAGCIPGINEVLRRRGLLPSSRCLNPSESLSTGQNQEIDRVSLAYPHLTDDEFVSANLETWLT